MAAVFAAPSVGAVAVSVDCWDRAAAAPARLFLNNLIPVIAVYSFVRLLVWFVGFVVGFVAFDYVSSLVSFFALEMIGDIFSGEFLDTSRPLKQRVLAHFFTNRTPEI